MTLKQALFLIGYIAIFGASVLGMLWWHRKRRKTRLPFAEGLKLLRAPGETQIMLVRKFEEDAYLFMFLVAFAPATVGAALLVATSRLPKEFQLVGVIFTLAAFVGAFYFAARCVADKARECGNRYLGYFGERVVAEHLEPLKQLGWHIFHDVPGVVSGRKFNLDHVAAGPGGVFVIETKTRRKGSARPGFDDHKVYFDGRGLVWPWGEDNHGLEQAERNAVWLAETLAAEIGGRVHVTPFLTLPGWWVENKPSRESRLCRVVNPKGLEKFLSSGVPVLDQPQIDAIAARLDARCRDIEF